MDSLIHLLNNRGQTFCLTFRAFLNTQKYGLFCSLDLGRLEQKTNMMENGLLYLGIKWSLLRPRTDLSSLGIKWSLLGTHRFVFFRDAILNFQYHPRFFFISSRVVEVLTGL